MRKNKNTSKIILATVVALMAGMFAYTNMSKTTTQLAEKEKLLELMQNTRATDYKSHYAYAIATSNLKAGEIVADTDVDFKQFETEDKNAFDNRSDLVNKILLQDINSGDVFTSTHIAKITKDDLTLKEGYRALTLPADNFQGRANTMLAGTSVDIYSSSVDTSWVLENVKILSFDSNKKSAEGEPKPSIMDASAITFEVSTDDISEFISNISKNRLVLVARGANDKKIIHKKKPSFSSNYSAKASSLPNLPPSVPIKDFPDAGLSGLPQPVLPVSQPDAVELIEANVKSKVTFE